MDGYERLNLKEADLVWDKERFYRIPEQERKLFMEGIEKIIRDEKGYSEPCNLYDKCRECPNFEYCVGIVSGIPNEIGAKP